MLCSRLEGPVHATDPIELCFAWLVVITTMVQVPDSMSACIVVAEFQTGR